MRALGDSALLFDINSAAAYDTATALAEKVASFALEGVVDVSSAYGCVAVYFDAGAGDPSAIEAAVRNALAETPAAGVPDIANRPLVEIPATYDGPDIEEVATRTGLTRLEVIELHSGREYRTHAIGFVPGFAFLGDLDGRLRLPRRDTPRMRVPAGSIGVAGIRTGVYPFVTPGGWHLIAHTGLRMFDPGRMPPALLRVGTRVRFIPQ